MKKTKTLPELTREADKYFSKYVRLRDSKHYESGWYGKCITCSKYGLIVSDEGKFAKGWDAGHFVTRGNKVVRFDERNVNLQCAFRCNKMRSGEPVKYRIALREKYGDEVPDELENLAEQIKYYKFTRDQLQDIIDDSKEQIKFYLSQGVVYEGQ